MKWIKASERLPLFSHKLISRFIHTQTPMFDFRDWALNNPDKLHLVEWLDESASLPSSSVTGEEDKDKLWKELNELIDKLPKEANWFGNVDKIKSVIKKLQNG